MNLFDEAWVREAAQRISTDEIFQKKGKGFNAVYQYVVKASPAMGVMQDAQYWIKYPQATEWAMGAYTGKPDFVMTASYSVMHDILAGKTNAILALTSRKAFVSGSLPTLLRYTGAINRVVEIFQSIPADGEGQFTPIGK
jgi:putative sterol carrier protein